MIIRDITSNALILQLLGEGDQVTTVIRVKGDGTFQHNKLYPKRYKIWLEGPLVSVENDTIYHDFSETLSQEINFRAVPLLFVKNPAIIGSATASLTEFSYEITGNAGNTTDKRELYVSTVPYPTGNIGDGPFYSTRKISLDSDAGTVSVEDLEKGRYYVRVGARADGANSFNYSDQIIVDIP